jgi:hypothetical protein
MELAAIDGIELAYELWGSGEPVVPIHWGVSARWAEPLIAQPLRRREKVRQIDVENIVTAPSQG